MDTLSTNELVAITGATYRQIDYWCVMEILKPIDTGKNKGSGYYRRFDPAIVPKVRLLAQISEAFDYSIRTEILRRIYDNYNKGKVTLGKNITLSWKPEPKANIQKITQMRYLE